MKRVLITGAAKRLGRALAEGLAAADCHLVIHHNRSAAEAEAVVQQLRARGAAASLVQADLARPDQVEGLIEAASRAAGGPLTALVNNASVFEYDCPDKFLGTTFERAMATNLRAPLILSQRFYEQAQGDSDNCIVHMLDQKLWNLNPDFFSYTLSKCALHSAIEMSAMAFAPRVRVCGIAPGILYPSYDQSVEEFRKVASLNLLRRPIDHADVVRGLAYILASPALNAQILHIDNGQRLVPLDRDVMFLGRQEG